MTTLPAIVFVTTRPSSMAPPNSKMAAIWGPRREEVGVMQNATTSARPQSGCHLVHALPRLMVLRLSTALSIKEVQETAGDTGAALAD